MERWILAALLSIVCLAGPANAEDPYVPPALEEWRNWVLHGQEWRECPSGFDAYSSNRDSRYCAWPGVLELDVTDTGAEFRQTWAVGGDITAVPLPGSIGEWPEDVAIDGRPALVLSSDELPFVELSAGTYTISGRFRWDSRPGELEISSRVGLIELTIDGERVLAPDIEGEFLFLGERAVAETARDEISTDVYRLAIDGMPSRLVTLLRLNVAGGLREADFGPFLPEGYVPERLDSQLPARFEANGQLRVQVRPGEWTVQLTARATGTRDTFAPLVGGANLPDVEILSFQSDPHRRVAVPSGLVPVDPGQAGVPGPWRSFPAYRVGPGDVLTLEERSRGIVDSQNELSLGRRLWLDFDGRGMTAVDSIGGTMRRDWRLDMQRPFLLESARVNGENVLVTAGSTDERRGVEVRQPALNMQTVARLDRNGAIPVTGWDTRFSNVKIDLNLPAGRRLVAAPGADVAAGAWLGRWQLLDIFLLLVITAASWRLFGSAVGVVAFAALGLSFHETGAPAWLWLNLLAAVALLRVAPPGRLRSILRTYFYLGLAGLALALVPFIADQFRYALYPQLEIGRVSPGVMQAWDRAPGAVSVDAVQKSVSEIAAGQAQELEEMVVTGARVSPRVSAPAPRRFERYAPNALVQAGPGMPGWQWQRYTLRWDGPVEAGQTVRLIVAPPWLVSAWRILAALLTALFAVWFVAEALRRQWTLPGGIKLGASPAMLAVIVAAPLFVSTPGTASAELPDPQMLEQLRQRLTEPPDCEPRCAEFVAARIEIDPSSLRIEMDVHASVDVAIPVPGFGGDWRPQRILVDGDPVRGVNRDEETLIVFVPAGQHEVRLDGELPDKSSIKVEFPEEPRVVEVTARGWSVVGVVDRRLVTGNVQFDRVRDSGARADAGETWQASRFPTFVTVTRRLELGLEWRIVTTVRRVAPASGALELGVPLVDGESVMSEELNIDGRTARVAMAPGVDQVAWASSLETTSEMRLEAGDGSQWVDTWEVAAGSIWHVEFDGVPESIDRREVPGARVASFHPRPGEVLTLSANRPEAVAGATTAIDEVRLNATIGRRLVESTLTFNYRATRGDQRAITLPPKAEITTVTIDGNTEPLLPVDGILTIPIRPGSHSVTVGFRQAQEHGVVSRAPELDLGSPASNVHVTLGVSGDRWLLLTSGPTLGPAVLYWPQLVVLIGLAFILGRIPWTPLRSRHWLLLGLGFSTFAWPVFALVVAWLLVTGSRERWKPALGRLRYNGLQIVHATLTVIALAAIVGSLPFGLLGTPDMHVVGNGSWAGELRWFADLVDGVTPDALFVSLPLWAYKALILAWALWLTFALIAWLPWVWRTFVGDGLWRGKDYDKLAEDAGD